MPIDIKKKMIHGVSSYIQYWKGKPVVDYNPDGSPTPPGPDFSEPFYVENITQDTEYMTLKRPVEVTKFDIEVSTDKTTWNTLTTTEEDNWNFTRFVLSPGNKVYIRASTPSWSDPNNGDNHSDISGMSKVGGNIMSLIYGSNFTGQETSFPADTRCNFQGLFQNVSELVDAADVILPVQNLPGMCYRDLFAGTSITVAPDLTCARGVIGDYSFHTMFAYCRNLVVAPSFSPNFNLSNGAYTFHVCFENCTALVNPPALPMTSLGYGSYNGMFKGCTSLTSAPALPATTLTDYCYNEMFGGCTSLTTAPTLSATSLAEGCYRAMFSGCTSLTTAPALPATTLADSCYHAMFTGCTALTTAPTISATTLARDCCGYMFSYCTSLTTAPVLPATTLANVCYQYMFRGCTSLNTLPSNMLPATTLATRCYDSMFNGCTSLTTAPALPATTLEGSCYMYMFEGCTSLTTAPALPATTLATGCYIGMFKDCTSLTTAPTLPATTLVTACYTSMFRGCTALTAAPELPATTLAISCYEIMFNGCSNLASIECLATNISATNCTDGWVDGVAASGTFVASYDGAQNDIWEYGVDGVPQGWSAEDEYGTPFTPRSGGGGVQYDDQYINVTNLGVTAGEYDSNMGTSVWPFQAVTGTNYESYKPSGTPIFLGDTASTSDYSRPFKAIVTGKDEYIDSIEISVSSRDDSGNSWDYTIDVYDENRNQLATLSDYQQQTLTVSFQNTLGSSEHLYIYVKSYSTTDGYRPMFGITSVS